MTKKKSEPSGLSSLPHMGAAMAKPFIDGARAQLERYLEAQRLVTTYHTVTIGYNRCLYEVSGLFEHLATVARYLELCGITGLQLSQPIFDVRNHIRHDVREEFDKGGKAKTERAKRLGLNPKLQMQLAFSDGGVTVGGTVITAQQISSFLDTADMTINAMMLGIKVTVNNNGVTASQPPASTG